ncbi:hypothetical protein BU26DRAFT_524183 [Trematosphaeria pertusa]|uniref:Pre-mRNA-splicing factor n=1 Tax=Trematosphaeria pertusa TaxID=390896 RepID=A0A6A6HXX7_9PLEO|nr:uncharacterized protein BU26DRAFT_524183 [Trematosphaeria pertusa]KAF2242582.1 hypothetical protein BU26DRAFT_524183 [Trematosphaeria pertusa]
MAAPKAGGFKLSLSGAKNKAGLTSTPQRPAKRPRLDLGDDAPEEDNKQEISGWDAAEGGAVDASGKKEESKGPRVIPPLPNRNWREEVRKRQLARAGGQGNQDGVNTEESKMAYGLTTFKKDAQEKSPSPEPMDTAEDGKEADDGLTEAQRLEKNALDALLHGKATDHSIIPIQSEEEAFQHDFREAPDAPTLEAYEAVPIEGFGAALLRGMGWKDGEEIGHDKKPAVKPKEIKRRPALLGIGAKEEAAVGIELGEWGKGKNKVKQSYNPVALRNKVTGEIITEEELKARLEAQKMVDDAKPEKNSSKYNDYDEEKRRQKRKERKDRDLRGEADYDSERRRDSDRRDERRRDRDDDSSDREKRREKRRYRDDYDDSDRNREKKRYRDDDYNDSDRRREKRRDRSRSPADEKRRERRRERDLRERDRSPDSDDYRREKRRERERRDRDLRSPGRDSDDYRREKRRERDRHREKRSRSRDTRDKRELRA